MKKVIILLLSLSLCAAVCAKPKKQEPEVKVWETLQFNQITADSSIDSIKSSIKKYSSITEEKNSVEFTDFKIDGIRYQSATFTFDENEKLISISALVDKETDFDTVTSVLLEGYDYAPNTYQYTAKNSGYMTCNRMNGFYLLRYYF